jgi:hypothetical protein
MALKTVRVAIRLIWAGMSRATLGYQTSTQAQPVPSVSDSSHHSGKNLILI